MIVAHGVDLKPAAPIILFVPKEQAMKRSSICALLLCFVSFPAAAQGNQMCSNWTEAKSWPVEQDAVNAAPDNHRVLLETDDLRVLEVTVRPGEREKVHHHRWPSVMVVTQRPSYKNYDKEGKEIPPATSAAPELPIVARLPAQAAHAINVLDTLPFKAIRVEFKRLCQ